MGNIYSQEAIVVISKKLITFAETSTAGETYSQDVF